MLEAHTDPVISVSFLDNGRLLASFSEKGTLAIWRVDNWVNIAYLKEIGSVDTITNHGLNITFAITNLAFHPNSPIMVSPGLIKGVINIWYLDLASLRNAEPIVPTIHYVNAKAVLLGDSTVGKSGLGIRIAEHKFRPTESTHGAQFWHLPVSYVPGLPSNVQAELTLWDLAGQPEYRLVHQLFVDDTDAAILLFDCSDPSDPFRGVPYWAKVLKKQAPKRTVRFLVSARSDVSPVTVDQQTINQFLFQYGLDKYFKTSAKSGEGVEELFRHILADIHWTELPRTSTPQLFQIVRDFLLNQKETGENLIPLDVIQREVQKRSIEHSPIQHEIYTVVSLLQTRGLVYRLDPRPDITLVLTRPELINQYASSIIQAARNNSQGIGAVPERDVLIGAISFSGFERLPRDQEAIVIEATVELLIRHDLCFREMGLLVFPSQINATRPTPQEAHPRTEVAYRFSGSIETIYASLVVRLSYTDYFHREDQWKYAVEFSRSGERLGFSMHQVEEGTGELELYFHPGINEFDRITFIRFITDHLRTKGIDIQEEIRLYCPKCGTEVTDHKAIETRIKKGLLEIPCQYCPAIVLIHKSIEERYTHDISLIEKQRKLTTVVAQRTESEIEQFKADQQYVQENDPQIHILHLSDIHLKNSEQAQVYRMQLETDLIKEQNIKRLEYIVISGDIANKATEEEYKAAYTMLDGLVKRFGLEASRVIIVPGNHDLSWDSSEAAYQFIPKRKLPEQLPEGKHILAGDSGALLCNEELYKERFNNFSSHFYKRIYNGQEYPKDYTQQAILYERSEDRILFLALNSSWQIDHEFQDRASINMNALANALERLQDETYDSWLKIAVWHHPVIGNKPMNNEFMQLLTAHGFQVCMQGHIHEASEGFYDYDKKNGIHIMVAGTFGAPVEEQTPGIPLQYNLLTFNPFISKITVNTRKKEKPNGAWAPDARWPEETTPRHPKPWYSFKVKDYQLRK